MDSKIIIKAANLKNNLLDSLISYMKSESMEYEIISTIDRLDNYSTNLIYLDEDDFDLVPSKKNLSIIFISNQRKIIKESKSTINYVVTDLINDNSDYTDVQKDYLFSKGIYSNLLYIVGQLLKNDNEFNGMVYDLTEIKRKPDDWIFDFESINETYKWLATKNKNLPGNFTQKVINFYSDKIYNDSLNEINYLSDKLLNIKRNKRLIDIFVFTREEFEKCKNNFFLKVLIKNISDTYSIYFVDKNEIMKSDLDIYNKLRDGIIIYNDCVYRDTYENELSLGFVDCKKETIEEYNNYFDMILNKYAYRVNKEGNINEFRR